MAVTIVADDLIEPTGRLDAKFFPDDNINVLLAGWIAQATETVEGMEHVDASVHDEAATAYVYHRAYSFIAQRMAATPSSVTLIGQSAAIGADRITYWTKLAAEQLALFDELVTPPVVETPRPVSAHMPTRVTW